MKIVCRDGSASFTEGIRLGAPNAIQVSDRWHLRHNLVRETTTPALHAEVHELLDQDVGLLECTPRLGLSLSTVKRYASIATAEQIRRPPKYGKTMIASYRNYLSKRRAEQPDVPTTHLLAEIRDPGYPGSTDLLDHSLRQGHADPGRTLLPPADWPLGS